MIFGEDELQESKESHDSGNDAHYKDEHKVLQSVSLFDEHYNGYDIEDDKAQAQR